MIMKDHGSCGCAAACPYDHLIETLYYDYLIVWPCGRGALFIIHVIGPPYRISMV